MTEVLQSMTAEKWHKCLCGYETKYRQNLHKHKKICKYEGKMESNSNEILMLQKENQINLLQKELELLKQQLADKDKQIEFLQQQLIKPTTNIDMSSNITTNNNTTFNLQLYLTECKDAVTIKDFLDNYNSPTWEELRGTFLNKECLEKNLVKQIGNRLNRYTNKKKPILCSCERNSTLYIKNENNLWEKYERTENIKQDKLRMAIEKIIDINYKSKINFNKIFRENENEAKETECDHIGAKLYSNYDLKTIQNGLAKVTKISIELEK